jgi:hypothetical protein
MAKNQDEVYKEVLNTLEKYEEVSERISEDLRKTEQFQEIRKEVPSIITFEYLSGFVNCLIQFSQRAFFVL